ncbi:MAG TPA: PQQ-binding-like beta-propeller repeat protein [Gaiellaceae bacterium]|nr:PQQ-binding-like beta-propeller repeat protein [Gaiellaceae bacterium]
MQGHERHLPLQRHGRLSSAAAAACLALVAGGCGGGGDAEGWALPNHDLAGTRATSATSIDAHDVARLSVAWRFRFPEEPTFSGVAASAPLVVGKRVIVQTLNSNVYALDARSGKLVWKRLFRRVDGGPNGLAAAGGRLFGSTNSEAFALDAATGRVLWERRLTTARQPIDIAPLVAKGLVYTSSVGMRPGGEGRLFALSASSGRVVWSFDTIAQPWADPSVATGGGAWWTPTLDAGRLYVGVSNPLPWGGTPREPNGAAYAGPARYTDSLLVLGAEDGRLEWFDQVTPHDVRDYDFALPPIVASPGGRELVIGGGKAGRVIAWSRETHRRVWSTTVGRHEHDSGPLPARLVTVCPGLLGGVLTPMAYASGRVFVPVVDLCMRGSSTGFPDFFRTNYASGTGELDALDAQTGARLWSHRMSSPDFGCATVAHDVVFTATYLGRVEALDTTSGRPLWSAREPAGVNACPTVSGDELLVEAGAEPQGIRTPTPQLVAYRLR